MGSASRLGSGLAIALGALLVWTNEGLGNELRCEPAPGGGTAVSSTPTLQDTLADRFHQAWLGSPAVADLDGDGVNEILATRWHLLLGWHLDGSEVYRVQSDDSDRFYAPPVVADIDASRSRRPREPSSTSGMRRECCAPTFP
ncbi:MAG: hypothetical protein QNK04_12630 [Myxococcota bacterium]|nr:hypothetical protein [Myxococcota bacterium]